MGDVIVRKINVPGLSDDENAVLNRNLERLVGRRRNNFDRSCLYDGKNALDTSSNVVPEQYYRMGIALGGLVKLLTLW